MRARRIFDVHRGATARPAPRRPEQEPTVAIARSAVSAPKSIAAPEPVAPVPSTASAISKRGNDAKAELRRCPRAPSRFLPPPSLATPCAGGARESQRRYRRCAPSDSRRLHSCPGHARARTLTARLRAPTNDAVQNPHSRAANPPARKASSCRMDARRDQRGRDARIEEPPCRAVARTRCDSSVVATIGPAILTANRRRAVHRA